MISTLVLPLTRLISRAFNDVRYQEFRHDEGKGERNRLDYISGSEIDSENGACHIIHDIERRNRHSPFIYASAVYLLMTGGAWASDQTQLEAHQFLAPCDQIDRDGRPLCEKRHAWFLRTYAAASTGDPAAMDELVVVLRGYPPNAEPSDYAGVREDHREGCAWEIVRLSVEPVPREQVHLFNLFADTCSSRATPTELAAMQQRAQALISRLPPRTPR